MQDPPFAEVSRCLAMIMGESRDSGLDLGLDALAVLRGVKKGLPCILGTEATDPRSGLIMGDFSPVLFRYEGRGAGKNRPPGGQIIVNRKR